MTTIPEDVTAVATVRGKEELVKPNPREGEEPTDYGLELEIDAFHSQYPTKVFGVPLKEGAALLPGRQYRVSLKRGQLKKNKEGSRYYDYNWRWAGLAPAANGAAAPTPTPPAKAPVTAPQATGRGVDIDAAQRAREASIERQVALKAAVELTIARIGAGELGVGTYHVAQIADYFTRLMAGTVTVKPLESVGNEKAASKPQAQAVDAPGASTSVDDLFDGPETKVATPPKVGGTPPQAGGERQRPWGAQDIEPMRTWLKEHFPEEKVDLRTNTTVVIEKLLGRPWPEIRVLGIEGMKKAMLEKQAKEATA